MKKEQTIAMLLDTMIKLSIVDAILMILEIIFILIIEAVNNDTAKTILKIVSITNITIAGILAIIIGYIDCKIIVIE